MPNTPEQLVKLDDSAMGGPNNWTAVGMLFVCLLLSSLLLFLLLLSAVRCCCCCLQLLLLLHALFISFVLLAAGTITVNKDYPGKLAWTPELARQEERER